jgi:hypothetical protein
MVRSERTGTSNDFSLAYHAVGERFRIVSLIKKQCSTWQDFNDQCGEFPCARNISSTDSSRLVHCFLVRTVTLNHMIAPPLVEVHSFQS